MRTIPAAALLFLSLFLTNAVADEPAKKPPAKESPKQPARESPKPPEYSAPDLLELIKRPESELSAAVQRYETDRATLLRTYPVPASPTRHARLARFYLSWRTALAKLDPARLRLLDRLDYVFVSLAVENELRQLDRQLREETAIAPLLPYAPTIVGLEEARRRMERVEPIAAAERVAAMKKQIELARPLLDDKAKSPYTQEQIALAAELTGSLRSTFRHWFNFHDGYNPLFSWWLAQPCKEADEALQSYAGFLRDKAKIAKAGEEADPPLTGGAIVGPAGNDAPDLAALIAEPHSEMAAVLRRYSTDRFGQGRMSAMGLPTPGQRSPERIARFKKMYSAWLDALAKLDFDKLSPDGRTDFLLLHTHLVRELGRLDAQAKGGGGFSGRGRDSGAVSGRPIGREALKVELAGELIPYTLEECIAIAEREAVWCQAELKKAAREMGCGDDWKLAIEKVKDLHVEPGRQPELIRDLAHEAIDYVTKFDLVTVPPLAQESWRMEMMSPQRQLVSPFFTGGEVITVSFPTSSMSHEAKLQSMRGNNVHFSRATVQHELVPGHHLQQYMTARSNTHRSGFGTSFWTEGWAVYWEMVLWDRGFPRSPEDRIGMLFWRLHRCARIVFSFNFHAEKWTTKECVDYLVRTVGHEYDNAAAEVRRSFGGGYGPLYQAGYLLGALQMREMRHELVDSGKMSEKVFHDEVLRENRIPFELIRARLLAAPMKRDHIADWKFYGQMSGAKAE